MKKRGRSGNSAFFLETAKWSLGLVALLLLFQLFAGSYPWGTGEFWLWVGVLVTNLGALLPCAVFAGGLATTRSLSLRGALARAGLVAIAIFGLLGYAAPIVEYQAHAARGADLSVFHPFGPDTPGAKLALREAVEANPPAEYSYSTEHPFRIPPNWLTALAHTSVAFALFSLLAALLGRWVGFLTTGLSPPVRRHVRWASGLAMGLAFFLPMMLASEWVRQNTHNSGLVGAYGPLMVPLGILAVLVTIERNRQTGSDFPGRPVTE